jgi:hypothetical protein
MLLPNPADGAPAFTKADLQTRTGAAETDEHCSGNWRRVWPTSQNHATTQKLASYFPFLFAFGGLSRTPCPSSRNSMPAFSRAVRIASTVRACAARSPRIVSRRLMVGSETLLAAAMFFCSHRSNALAARNCSLVIIPSRACLEHWLYIGYDHVPRVALGRQQ